MFPHFQQVWRNCRRRRHVARGQGRQLARAGLAAGAVRLLAAACALAFVAGGIMLIISHARRLPTLLPHSADTIALPQWQNAFPGLRFEIDAGDPAVSWQAGPQGGLWRLRGMQAAPPVLIDLCQQKADAKRWLPIHVGGQFDEVRQNVAQNRQRGLPDGFGLKSVVLSDEAGPKLDFQASTAPAEGPATAQPGSQTNTQSSPQSSPQSRTQLSTPAERHATTQPDALPQWQVRRRDAAGPELMLLSDLNPAGLQPLVAGGAQAWRRAAWFTWQQGGQARALHAEQRTSRTCAHGQLRLQWYQPARGEAQADARGRALVQAFTWQQGALPAIWLGPGHYQVPQAGKPVLEDQQLFDSLLANGLLRQQAGGTIELVPRDWLSAVAMRVPDTAIWPDPARVAQAKRLLRRLYGAADGSYVRQQVQIFNRERGQVVSSGDMAYRHIKFADGKLQWQSVKTGPTVAAARADVTIYDRQQQLLWRNGQLTPAAEQAGLASLLGGESGLADAASVSGAAGTAGSAGTGSASASDAGHSVAGMLARVPGAAHSAHLTLDLTLQTLAQQIVGCMAMGGGKWDGRRCQSATQAASVPERRAGLLLQNAETGEILVASQSNPATRALLPWQHDGSNYASPGSTFKVVTSLALEQAAQNHPSLQALLAGLPLAQLNSQAAQQGFAFRSDGACYPAPCGAGAPQVTNYRDQIPLNKAQDGRFGLVQAMSYSMNTWFAYAAEQSDASLFGQPHGGMPDLYGLQGETLDTLRPVMQVAHQLGFERSTRLDGGLLPANFGWKAGDGLQSQAAHIELPHSRHETRQIALGLRMQSHLLQMAQVAGAVGQGELAAPSLLAQLDNRVARPAPAQKLAMRLDRVRAGMAGVVAHGTAAGAFNSPAMAALRPHLYGKTGTAPVAEGQNSAWFIGYLEPGQLPGQKQRWAFAAWVSHTDLTGGAAAAPLVAAFLASVAQGAAK
jgi:cell division protein FtsI/penicillin-binding protein 2